MLREARDLGRLRAQSQPLLRLQQALSPRQPALESEDCTDRVVIDGLGVNVQLGRGGRQSSIFYLVVVQG